MTKKEKNNLIEIIRIWTEDAQTAFKNGDMENGMQFIHCRNLLLQVAAYICAERIEVYPEGIFFASQVPAEIQEKYKDYPRVDLRDMLEDPFKKKPEKEWKFDMALKEVKDEQERKGPENS